ncbi:MAG: 3-oxoacyl-ACP reductase family protein [Myxococcota bacterium]|nr:3-oxoacyl-ACP reductase family protein [Myxococcota bacterium]
MIAIITGASRGIGRAIAIRLARDYAAQLVLVYRSRKEDAEETAARCTEQGSLVRLEQADVGDADAVKRLVQTTVDEFGRIDVLVNNAGITADGLTLQMSDEDWHQVMTTNAHSVFYLARAVARPMMLKKHGRIINISSISARRPNRGQANYAASKGALEAFTRAMAVEMGSKKITVNAVSPGVIETEMSARIRDAAGKEIARSIPLRRFGQPEDVAGLVSFLAGPDSGYITGQVIGVDGGIGL